MGGADIRIITAPKDELSIWWSRLNPTHRFFVKTKIVRLLPLLEVIVHTGFVRELVHFWCLETATFAFGKHELTLTLKEYSIVIGKSLDSELIIPPIGMDPILTSSEFLSIKEDEVRKFLKGNRGTCLFFISRSMF